MQIRPISDLRNKFFDIESLVFSRKEPVFLTKNGYGFMVVMSLDMYESLTKNIEAKLDAADIQAEETAKRLSHDEVFEKVVPQKKSYFGALKDKISYIAPDFDEPLEDFAEYM